jgi:hypothetical protein
MEEMRNAYKILVRPKGNKQLRRWRCRWEDNIRIYLREMGWGGVDLMHLAQDMGQWWPVINTVRNLGVHKSHGIF